MIVDVANETIETVCGNDDYATCFEGSHNRVNLFLFQKIAVSNHNFKTKNKKNAWP